MYVLCLLVSLCLFCVGFALYYSLLFNSIVAYVIYYISQVLLVLCYGLFLLLS